MHVVKAKLSQATNLQYCQATRLNMMSLISHCCKRCISSEWSIYQGINNFAVVLSYLTALLTSTVARVHFYALHKSSGGCITHKRMYSYKIMSPIMIKSIFHKVHQFRD